MSKVLSRWFETALIAAAFLFAPLPAHAGGPGTYNVSGKDSVSGQAYSGSATLSKTGGLTWRITWRVKGASPINGYGLGDGTNIALSWSAAGKSGVALLTDKKDGSGYDVIWAYSGDKAVSIEDWKMGR